MMLLFLKTHVEGYTRKDGTYVAPHEDKRAVRAREPAVAQRHAVNSSSENSHPTEVGRHNFSQWFGASKVTDKSGRPLVVYHGSAGDISAFKDKTSARGSLGAAYFTDSRDTASHYAALGGIHRVQGERVDLDTVVEDALDNEDEVFNGRSPNVIPAYLKIENPIDVETVHDVVSIIGRDAIIRTIENDSALPEFLGLDFEDDVDFSSVTDKQLASYINQEYTDEKVRELIEHDGDSLENATSQFRFLVVSGLLEKYAEARGADGVFIGDDPENGGNTWIVFHPEQVKSAIGNNGNFNPKSQEMTKAVTPVVLFFKGYVGPYMRGGKMVNLNGYHGSRTKKVHATTGQTSLFGDLAPPPEVKQTAKVARALTTWMQRHGGPAGMARLLADMSPEHQEKLVDAMAKIGKTDAATVRGLLADGQKAPASTGERDLFSEPEQSAAKEAPQEKPKNNLAEGLPKTEGEVIARKEVTMMVNKRQENGKFSRYATGRYIITLQSAEGKKFIIAYSVMSKNGVSTTVMIPTEMLEDGAFSKLNDEAIKLFNAPSGGLFDGDKEDTITMPRAEAVKEHERLVDVLRSPSHEDDKAEAKKQAEELKEYKGEDASGDQEQTREDYKAMVDRISEFHAKKIGRQSVAQLKKMIQGKIKEGFNRFEKAANGDWVLTDGKRAYNITQNEQLRTYGSLIEAMVYHANAKPAEKPKAPAKKVEYTTDANGVPRDKNGYARMKMGRKNVVILPFDDSGQYAIRDAKTAITQMGEDGKPLVFTNEAAAIAHVRGGQSTTKPTPKKILTVKPGTTAAAGATAGRHAGATSRKPFDLVPDDEAITRIKAAGYEMTDAGERSVFVDGNQQKRRAFSLKHSGNGKLGVGDTVTLPIAEDMLQRIEGRAKDAKDGKLTSGANLLNASARQMRNETVDYKKPAGGEQAAPKAGGDKKILFVKPSASAEAKQASSNLSNNSPEATPKQEKKMINLTEDQRTKIARGGAAWEAWKAEQPEGEATRAAFKEAARSGKLDHLFAVQIKADADREAEIKAAKKEKSDKWREKNVPKLAAAKQKREEQWRAEQQAKWSDPNGERTYLRVPFDSKDEAKAAGARWDADKKSWYHTFSETPAELRRFVPVSSPVVQQPKPIPQTEPKNATKHTLPTYGRVSEDDPSVWGSWLLGYEGELWSEIRRHAPEHLR